MAAEGASGRGAPEGRYAPPGLEPLGAPPPMGPNQDPPERRTNQERSHRAAKMRTRRPRLRRCLLKGCERRFRPKHPRSRYCGEDCRSKARRWSRWKAQKRYRSTGWGKQQRKAQNCRHRQRVRARKGSKPTTNGPARVITTNFFRLLLRPTGLLRSIHADAPFSTAAILLEGMQACAGACPGAGAAVEGTVPTGGGPAVFFQGRSFPLMEGSS